MTDVDKIMNPHVGNDPAVIRSRIPINPEWNPGSLLVEVRPWRRFALSEHSLVMNNDIIIIVIVDVIVL